MASIVSLHLWLALTTFAQQAVANSAAKKKGGGGGERGGGSSYLSSRATGESRGAGGSGGALGTNIGSYSAVPHVTVRSL